MIRLLRTLSLVAVPAAVLLVFGGCPPIRLPDPAVRFVAFGDSSTDGPSERQYWEIVRDRLGEAPETFSNEGVGGERSSDGLKRLDFLIDRGIFPNAHTLFYWQGAGGLVDFVGNRDKLLILDPASPDYPYAADLNAKLDEIQAEIEAAVAAAQAEGWRVFVVTYFPFRDGFGPCGFLPFELLLPAQAVFANHYQELLNDHIRAAAANRGATLVDVGAIGETLLADPANYFDCNHLSARGNELVADVFMRALTPPPQ
jgi:hypothetical protein